MLLEISLLVWLDERGCTRWRPECSQTLSACSDIGAWLRLRLHEIVETHGLLKADTTLVTSISHIRVPPLNRCSASPDRLYHFPVED